MRLPIGEASRRAGVSVRTLQYYDKIGLLSPFEVSDAGYRFYDEKAMARLYQILFYKELGFPLEEIRLLLLRPEECRNDALVRHHSLLLKKRESLDRQIRLLEELTGGASMNEKAKKHETYEELKDRYAEEARERWGNTAAYASAQKAEGSRSSDENHAALKEMEKIFEGFARIREHDPASPEAQAAVVRLQEHITRYYYPCGAEMLGCLGEMYVSDERFTQNIDQAGQGTALFARDAIRAFCRQHA